MKKMVLGCAVAALLAGTAAASAEPEESSGGGTPMALPIIVVAGIGTFLDDQAQGNLACAAHGAGLYYVLDSAGHPHCVPASELPWTPLPPSAWASYGH